MLNEIASRTGAILLVLDDVHLLTDAAILQAIEFLLHYQPSQLHVVLSTREDPDLPLARLRARDQLTEIRARDLRFTRVEADTFLRGVMGLTLSDQDVATLEGRTEGWAVGLQLAGLSMQKQADQSSFIAEFSGSHRHILDYLTEEVLQQPPEQIRTFLLQTSILERLSGPLCNALTGLIDSDRVLARLEADNLFIIPLDDERRWYRYHHLFFDLLRNQLTRTQPGMIPELHRRAARWHEEHGDIQDLWPGFMQPWIHNNTYAAKGALSPIASYNKKRIPCPEDASFASSLPTGPRTEIYTRMPDLYRAGI